MINITGNIYLDADDYQYTLIQWEGQRRKDNTGMQNAKYRYYSNLESALKGLANILIRRNIQEVKSLEELKQAVAESLAIVNNMASSIELIAAQLRQRHVQGV